MGQWRKKRTLVLCIGMLFLAAAAFPFMAKGEALAKAAGGQEETREDVPDLDKERTSAAGPWLDDHREIIVPVFFAGGIAALCLVLWKKNKAKKEALERVRIQSKRLQKLSQLLNECLFEYSYTADRLILQNNRLMFPGVHIMENFLKRTDFPINNKNEQIAADALKDILRRKDKEKELVLDLDGVESWYCIKMGMAEEDYAVGRILNVSKSAVGRKEPRRRANIDSLTGLLNRASLKQYLNAYLQNGPSEGAFLLMDLDNFKRINDELGHDQGDALLKAFAAYLQKHFRSSDMKARLGGDEFAIFMPGHFEEIHLAEKLTGLIQGLNQEVFQDYQEQKLSASIGAAYIGQKTEIAVDLYKEADSAMYVAKHGGKNSFFISDGTACMRRTCVRCREKCRKREYLEGKQETLKS